MVLDFTEKNKAISEDCQLARNVIKEVSKVIVGQKSMVEGLMIGLLTNGHILLEGLPGLAKTLTISTLAKVTSLNFQRIQFTPDLLPTDLIGTMVFHPKTGDFYPKKGPIFSHIVLADEINRAAAKVQSALLEAMAEKQVTIGEVSYELERPFLVLATQNPIEQEGTYPLPEAQMDRFMMKVVVAYPNRKEELEILKSMVVEEEKKVNVVMGREDVFRLKKTVESVYVDEKLNTYIVDLVLATREPEKYGLSRLKPFINVGGSPRATINLSRAAKAYAFLNQRAYVTAEDIKAILCEVLGHRLVLSYEAEAEGVTDYEIIKELVQQVEVP